MIWCYWVMNEWRTALHGRIQDTVDRRAAWGARGIIMPNQDKAKNIYIPETKRVMLFTLGLDKIHSTHTTYKITISIFNIN